MIDFNDVKPQNFYDRINSDNLRQNVVRQLESILLYLFPAGQIRYDKFYIGDIRGNRGKSLVVELTGSKAGCWHDFESGEGGDIFRLWGLVNGFSDNKSAFPKILESISEYLGDRPSKRRFDAADLHEAKISDPVKTNEPIQHICAETPKAYPIDELGKPTDKWDYKAEDGNLIACVYRYDTPEGKEFRPWDVLNKRAKAPEIRPLYRIPDIAECGTIVLVEGEKCADALYGVGLTATTAMNGAKAPLDKTDWSPLEDKSIVIWPDNDEAGKEYGRKVSEYLRDRVSEIVLIAPPADKPEKWDAADAVQEGMNVKDFVLEEIARVMSERNNRAEVQETEVPRKESVPAISAPEEKRQISDDIPKSDINHGSEYTTTLRQITDETVKQDGVQNIVPAYDVGCFLNDKSPMPEDLLAPRILTPRGLLVFGGAPKVGKSDFLISLLVHMAAGKSFLGAGQNKVAMQVPRPLRIFYLQAEVEYHYLRERLQRLNLENMMPSLLRKNLVITPQIKILLDEDGVEKVANTINTHFPDNCVDVIVVDPLRNVFSAQGDANENDNSAMLFFLQQRLEALRDRVNKKAGIILVHHTKKVAKKQFEEDPFQMFSGAGSLRSYYTSGVLMHQPDDNSIYRTLMFELRNGPKINDKVIGKENGAWREFPYNPNNIGNKNYNDKLKAERKRKHNVILEILYDKALKGSVYTQTQFTKQFQDMDDLGSRNTIYAKIDELCATGHIKFFRNYEEYNIDEKITSKQGLMCVEGMMYATDRKIEDPQTGQLIDEVIPVKPTHYKSHDNDGATKAVEDSDVWLYYDNKNDSKDGKSAKK